MALVLFLLNGWLACLGWQCDDGKISCGAKHSQMKSKYNLQQTSKTNLKRLREKENFKVNYVTKRKYSYYNLVIVIKTQRNK